MSTYFYVSALRDDGARSIVSGPYLTQEAAERDVFPMMDRYDLFRQYAWGTCASPVPLTTYTSGTPCPPPASPERR
jgi:hypothetical protein